MDSKAVLDFKSCILSNYDPFTMSVIFPSVLDNFIGSDLKSNSRIEIINSQNLPKIKVTIKSNRM